MSGLVKFAQERRGPDVRTVWAITLLDWNRQSGISSKIKEMNGFIEFYVPENLNEEGKNSNHDWYKSVGDLCLVLFDTKKNAAEALYSLMNDKVPICLDICCFRKEKFGETIILS